MENETLYHQIKLTMVPGVGDVNARNLVSYCGGVREVFAKSQVFLKKIPGIGHQTAQSIINFNEHDRILEELAFIQKQKIKTLFYSDKDYPQRMINCSDSPTLLYYKGEGDLNNGPFVAIIGTRNATDYGKSVCTEIINGLANIKPVIVSGLAYGIDIAAHKEALKSGLKTIAVLAHGLDRVYPQLHKSIATEMIQSGGLLTEFMSQTNPDKENFPRRNRIVAGMVDCVIVVESDSRGGALITANIANSYNKDVFAVPGRINDRYSKGTNYLIQSLRANIYTSVNDLMKNMGWISNISQPKQQKQLLIDLTPDEKIILDVLKNNGQTGIDKLVFLSGLSTSLVASALLELEFKSAVRTLPGKQYDLA